jgi:hypothetical protein
MDKLTLKAFIALLITIFAFYWWFGDHDYESCILNHIEDAQNQYAAFAVKSACAKKFEKYSSAESPPVKCSGLSLSQVRAIGGYETMTDEEIINIAKKNGINICH